MKKKRQGFTLIELLAVIVILGLLMAIAIPSVTKYITQSRKKTLTTTIGNYISALTNQANDMEYVFTGTNTVYAVPIECIALERGGTDPFGEWMQASNSYWAYVLVQYDDNTSSYTYGFTFKDSAGYGLYPTTSEKLNEDGRMINTGLDLSLPLNGKAKSVAPKENWLGFNVDESTSIIVLQSASEGKTGDGKTTCTLCQKGKNYLTSEEEKKTRPRGFLNNIIHIDNTLITMKPKLDNNISDESGLYSSSDTNSGRSTYYFRGNVKNNNVEFAGLNWKIIRINEDGTVRLILTTGINEKFNSVKDSFDNFYYSNSDIAKVTMDNWYKTNIKDKGYDAYVSTGTFCEEAKVTYGKNWTPAGNAAMILSSNYTPNFKCSTDANGKGIINSKVGLVTYDEVKYAVNYAEKNNNYIVKGYTWTMSPSGYGSSGSSRFANLWFMSANGGLDPYGYADIQFAFRPVINLTTDVVVSGFGTSSDPYVIQVD